MKAGFILDDVNELVGITMNIIGEQVKTPEVHQMSDIPGVPEDKLLVLIDLHEPANRPKDSNPQTPD